MKSTGMNRHINPNAIESVRPVTGRLRLQMAGAVVMTLLMVMAAPVMAQQTPAPDEPAAEAIPAVASPAEAQAGASAVVFMYHRFGESDYPSTNIRPEQLDAHIAELKRGPYHVMDVGAIVQAIANGESLPDRTVGITIDDAYRSVFDVAWPVFKKHNFPMTVFVSTEQVDTDNSTYMSWDQLRTLVAEGVTIGGHSQHHSHLATMPIAAVKAELAHSAQRFKDELGFVPDLFAYPYGEASLEVREAVLEAGYKAAFGQHSGAFDDSADLFYLPRYALNESYGTPERFLLAANSVPMPVSDITPADYLLQRNPPAFGFTLHGPARDLNCYPSSGVPTMTRLGDARVEIRLDGPVAPGRWRINCTSLGPDNRWRWFGMLYTVPEKTAQ